MHLSTVAAVMKINVTNQNQHNFDVRKIMKTQQKTEAKIVDNNKNFDKIIIETKDDTTINDTDFLKALKSKITSEIKESTDTKKIDKISNEIYSSEYNVNSSEIARKIMIGL